MAEINLINIWRCRVGTRAHAVVVSRAFIPHEHGADQL